MRASAAHSLALLCSIYSIICCALHASALHADFRQIYTIDVSQIVGAQDDNARCFCCCVERFACMLDTLFK